MDKTRQTVKLFDKSNARSDTPFTISPAPTPSARRGSACRPNVTRSMGRRSLERSQRRNRTIACASRIGMPSAWQLRRAPLWNWRPTVVELAGAIHLDKRPFIIVILVLSSRLATIPKALSLQLD